MRDAAGITQDAAARAIGVARTTIVAIEKGERTIRSEELQKLTKLYGSSVNALLRREAIHIDLAPRFRKLDGVFDAAVAEASTLLTNLAQAEVELENLLGIERPQNYPAERPLLKGDVRAQAENDAAELRYRLGLGNAPIADIATLLEMELGVRVFVRPLDSKISGLFAFDEAVGACILLNAKHPRERRAQSAGHETGHFISSRYVPEILQHGEQNNSREERYANAFARAFLTPPRAVVQKFNELTLGSNRLSRRHVILLANYFGVAREAIVRRLEELSLVKPGTWDWFADNNGITEAQARQVLGDIFTPDPHTADAARPTTIRLNLLAAEAMRQGVMSEGQLARLLGVDRIELRELFTDEELAMSEGDAVADHDI